MYRNQQVIGYMFDRDGRYKHKYYFQGTTENIASFMMNHASSKTVVTDMLDFLIASSSYGFLDKVPDQEYVKELGPEIMKMQMDEKEPVDICFRETEYGIMMQDELIKEHYLSCISMM
ncbi:MAG: hypothetical protein E7192_01820 [Erysipelotrichaceae bacterium]|nr:hypothetical protein [Erysipelotrichaceae bacterium]